MSQTIVQRMTNTFPCETGNNAATSAWTSNPFKTGKIINQCAKDDQCILDESDNCAIDDQYIPMQNGQHLRGLQIHAKQAKIMNQCAKDDQCLPMQTGQNLRGLQIHAERPKSQVLP